jgi:small subunit ribosomal protein S17
MVKTKQNKQEKEKVECKDRLCPFHGKDRLKLRGRTFEGTVIRKLQGRVTIQFERMLKVKKYERYEKRRTKLHARLPDCLKSDINIGDIIEVSETRPISKTIHFVVSKLIREKGK